MRIDKTNFSALTVGEQIRHFEVEGFVVLPDLLDTNHIRRLKDELADTPMKSKSYSEAQTVSVTPPQWVSPAVAELIGHPARACQRTVFPVFGKHDFAQPQRCSTA